MATKEETASLTIVKDEIAKGVRLFKAFEHGEKIVAAIEGLEQNEKELSKAVDERKKELAVVDKKLAEKSQEVTTAETDAENILVKAHKDAQQIIIDAETEAETARKKGDQEVADLRRAIETRKTELAKVNADIDNRQAELTKINDAIVKQKAALAGALSAIE